MVMERDCQSQKLGLRSETERKMKGRRGKSNGYLNTEV